MERQMAKLRQSSAAPARHARFGGLFVKRYHSESRGSVMRSNPLAPNLPAIPELKKTSKTQVIYNCEAMYLSSANLLLSVKPR